MSDSEPFEAGRDPVLAAELRRLLDRGDDVQFRERVLARLPERGGGTLWEVLAQWTHPGIAAAVVAASLLCYWLVLKETRTLGAEPTTELAATGGDLDRDALMRVVLGSGQ